MGPPCCTPKRETLSESTWNLQPRGASGLDRPEHHVLLLHLAAYVAAVDGAYDDDEVDLLKSMCSDAGLEPSVLNATFQWVEDG